MRCVVALVAGLAMPLAVAAPVSADIVTDWNAIALDAIRTSSTPPPRASRALAIVSTSVFDAVNAIDRTHAPYLYNAQALPGTDKNAAVIAAASNALLQLFPQSTHPTQYATILTARNTQLAAIADSAGKFQGIGQGDAASNTIYTARTTDNSTAPSTYTPQPVGTPGRWQPTPPANAAALLPQWGGVTPFAIQTGASFRPATPAALNTATYAAALNEVKQLGGAPGTPGLTRNAEQTDIARAWAFGGNTITPPGGWNKIATDLSAQRGLTVSQNARMFAMLNVAQADAAIACWDAKYVFDLWRPITAIRQADIDGNAATAQDATWSSLLTTPNFPAYTSGHSTFSRSAVTILANLLGGDAINLTVTLDNGIVRTLTSLDGAANEAGLSRIYGGIHFNFDNTEGQNCGQLVANYVLANYFGAIPAPSAGMLLGVAGLTAIRRRR